MSTPTDARSPLARYYAWADRSSPDPPDDAHPLAWMVALPRLFLYTIPPAIGALVAGTLAAIMFGPAAHGPATAGALVFYTGSVALRAAGKRREETHA